MEKRNRLTFLQKLIILLLASAACFFFVQAGLQLNNVLHRPEEVIPEEPVIEPAEPEDPFVQKDTVLHETPDAGQEYVDETLFLGDSNTVRFMQFWHDDGTPFTTVNNTAAVVGMGVDAITTLPCMQFSTGTYTMVDTAAILQPRRIILTFGTNNLDGVTMDTSYFIASYTYQINTIIEAWPYADIIVNSIYPFAEITEYGYLTVPQVQAYNDAIVKMCRTNGWKYLNTYDVLADPVSGFARPEYMDWDGLHLNGEGIEAVFECIRTHAYITEDRRPPLQEIPYVYGPLFNYYIDLQNAMQVQEYVPEPPAEEPVPAEEENTSESDE